MLRSGHRADILSAYLGTRTYSNPCQSVYLRQRVVELGDMTQHVASRPSARMLRIVQNAERDDHLCCCVSTEKDKLGEGALFKALESGVVA